jgi:hypothetical protein
MYLVGWLSFMAFAKGEVEEWAKIGQNFVTVEMEEVTIKCWLHTFASLLFYVIHVFHHIVYVATFSFR